MTGWRLRWPRSRHGAPVASAGLPASAPRRFVVHAAGVVLAAGLAGCGLAGPPTTMGPSGPAGLSSDAGRSPETPAPPPTWVLTSGIVRGRPIPLLPDHPITLVLTATELFGVSTCNSYWADLERSGPNIRLANIRTTIMDCGNELMPADEAFLTASPLVTRIDDGHPKALVLEGPGVRFLFEPAPIEAEDG